MIKVCEDLRNFVSYIYNDVDSITWINIFKLQFTLFLCHNDDSSSITLNVDG